MHLARIVDRCTVTQRNSCSCEGDGASAGPKDGESSEVSKCQKWNRQCVLYLTVFALFLTSYGYDPYLRDQELEVLVADDEDDGVLYRSPSAYHDPDAEEQGDEELELHFHVLLYLPRIVAVIAFMFSELSNISRATLQKIVHFGHLLVALLYTLLHLPNFLSYELRFIGCISELFWSAKLYLYLYQLVVYSPAAERLHFLIAGMLATSLGSASHPLIAELGSSYPFLSQYILNLIISILHVALFQPMMFCSGRYLTDNSTLLRPFLPFLSGDDLYGVFWQLFYVAVAFSGLGFLLIYLRTSDLMVASFCSQFLTGVLYLYLEEPIAARLCLVMNAFVFAVALEQLQTMANGARQTCTLMGATFTMINLSTYVFFGLLLLLWSSPDIAIIVIWAFNGFFALIITVLRKWLNCETDANEPGVIEPQTFVTHITTIS
uniref:Uncharacterized protein n=1 Tax=Anopheles atroparvus TaxID=41427 RepID=A0A182IXQ8_ANOAO